MGWESSTELVIQLVTMLAGEWKHRIKRSSENLHGKFMTTLIISVFMDSWLLFTSEPNEESAANVDAPMLLRVNLVRFKYVAKQTARISLVMTEDS